MAWPAWSKDEPKQLACYAVPATAASLKLAIGADDVLARGEYRRLAELIYEALKGKDLRYAREAYHPDAAQQVVRDPYLMIEGGHDGTCLDLALLFAGIALGYGLLPAIVVIRGHALVAVSLTRGANDAGAKPRADSDDDGAWVAEGLLTKAATLRRLVKDNSWLAIECTGFARSEALPDSVPEGKGRDKNGLMDFGRACAAGREQLAPSSGRPFEFALDVAVRQRVKHVEPYKPPSRSLQNVVPELRSRLKDVFERHRLFGGRDSELDWLNRQISERPNGYTFITGDSGSGKSALMVNWVNRLLPRRDVRVAYHFISRQHQLAKKADLLRTLCQQLLNAHGRGDLLPGDIVDLEALYLELVASAPPLGKLVVVIDGLDEAEDWEPGRNLFPSSLPERVHIAVSARKMAGRNWLAELGLPSSAVEQKEVGNLDLDAVKALLCAAGGRATEFAVDDEFVTTLRDQSGGDPFYLYYVIQDIIAPDSKITSVAKLKTQPTGLEAYLERWWKELQQGVDNAAVEDLLGYLLVASGSLTRSELAAISSTDNLRAVNVEGTIGKVDRFLVGTATDGYTLCHPRFRDHLLAEHFPLPDLVQYRDALFAWCANWRSERHRYAFVGYAADLLREARRTDTGSEAAQHLAKLVTLLTDDEFQKASLEITGDLPALQQNFLGAASCAAEMREVQTLPLLVSVALGLGEMRERWLKPELVFADARAGKLAEARRRLALFAAEDRWVRAAMLLIAWCASTAGKDGARKFTAEHRDLFDEHSSDLTLDLLRKRVACAVAEGPVPPPVLVLPYGPGKLPEAPLSPGELRRTVARIGGSDRGINISGMRNAEPVGRGPGDEVLAYIAEEDSPDLVRAVVANAGEALPILFEYMAIHAANPYREYRNRSLWAILGAVLCDPESGRAIRLATELARGALGTGTVEYREGLGIAAIALRAARGDAGALQKLRVRRDEAIEVASRLGRTEDGFDPWGHHARRHAALAEGFALACGDFAAADLLLTSAKALHKGYAGFQAPASLRLAEASLLCRPSRVEASNAIDRLLHIASASAYKVQDAPFCAFTVARVNTMIRRWWRQPITDVAAVIERFLRDPQAPEFCPVYDIGERYVPRGRGPDILPIPEPALDAVTLREVAENVFHHGVAGFARLNSKIEPDMELKGGTEVTVPDAEFAPLVASRLSAEALAQRGVAGVDCVSLIRRLVPVVTLNATALDTVLTRLAFAANPSSEVVEALAKVAPKDWMRDPAPYLWAEA